MPHHTGPRIDRTPRVGEWWWDSESFHKKYTQGTKDACWNWEGNHGPYGALFGAYKNTHKQMTQARRIAYMEEYGEDITENAVIMRCQNKLCVNPQHLELAPNRRRYG